MNSAPVRIYDQSVTLIGEVADYVSLQYTRRWYTPGSFEFHVIPEEADRSLLQVKNLIQVGNSPERRTAWQLLQTACISGRIQIDAILRCLELLL